MLVDLHIMVDPTMTVFAGHEISEQVKDRLRSLGPDVLDVVVHLEPFSEENPVCPP
jgi:divalent metal cation (Fe/Co/Zn/Cd) transporter